MPLSLPLYCVFVVIMTKKGILYRCHDLLLLLKFISISRKLIMQNQLIMPEAREPGGEACAFVLESVERAEHLCAEAQ